MRATRECLFQVLVTRHFRYLTWTRSMSISSPCFALRSFRKAELKTFLQFHREGTEPLRDDEITILNGVLSLNEKKASQIMTPIKVSRISLA